MQEDHEESDLDNIEFEEAGVPVPPPAVEDLPSDIDEAFELLRAAVHHQAGEEVRRALQVVAENDTRAEKLTLKYETDMADIEADRAPARAIVEAAAKAMQDAKAVYDRMVLIGGSKIRLDPDEFDIDPETAFDAQIKYENALLGPLTQREAGVEHIPQSKLPNGHNEDCECEVCEATRAKQAGYYAGSQLEG